MRCFHQSRKAPSVAHISGGDASPEAEGRIKALETAVEALQGRFAAVELARLEGAQHAHETRTVVNEHSARFEELIFAVSEGISKVERAEARIRATVRRARAELEESGTYSPALDAEAQELRVTDGGAGEPEEVQPVHEGLAPPDLSGIPGDWSPEDFSILTG